MQLKRARWPLLALVVVFGANATAQDESGVSCVTNPNQEVRIASLPSITAQSKGDSSVAIAAVATAVMDSDVCCGRNSALEDRITTAPKSSLKELGERLRGKHYLDSGYSIVIDDQYWSGASANAEIIITALDSQRPLLMDWNNRLYVVYGAAFDETVCTSGTTAHSIHTLMLVDVRYSDQRRYITFDRQTDDWNKVAGILTLEVKR